MTAYKTYRDKCSLLEGQLQELRSRMGPTRKDCSITYLLDTTETFLRAASLLIGDIPTPPIESED